MQGSSARALRAALAGMAAWGSACGRVGFDADLTADDAAMAVDASGLRLVFHSNRNADADLDLFEATRATSDAPWGEPQPLTELNTSFDDATRTWRAVG
jgi:hypothetical protein